MHWESILLLVVIALGGAAVIGSYVVGLRGKTGAADAFWGGVPAKIRPLYGVSMLLSAVGFLAVLYYIFFRLTPEDVVIGGRFGFALFFSIFVLILWPVGAVDAAQQVYLQAPSTGRWVLSALCSLWWDWPPSRLRGRSSRWRSMTATWLIGSRLWAAATSPFTPSSLTASCGRRFPASSAGEPSLSARRQGLRRPPLYPAGHRSQGHGGARPAAGLLGRRAGRAERRQGSGSRGGRCGAAAGASVHDLTELLWCSIDNDDSLDLDQLTVAQATAGRQGEHPGGGGRRGLAWWRAERPSTSTPVTTPRRSTRRPRSSPCCPRSSPPGSPRSIRERSDWRWWWRWSRTRTAPWAIRDIYRARVRNRAKLAYSSVAAWLDGSRTRARGARCRAGLAENLRLQDEVAQRLKAFTTGSRGAHPGDHSRGAHLHRRQRSAS